MREIKPALNPEEWALALEYAETYDEPVAGYDAAFEGAAALPRTLHYLAALALHGQPFGFTWEDVDLLRREASMLLADIDDNELAHWRDLADRIAALLPPREP